ncbi:unnamed protein product [Rotaria sp. Silwood2]|nr:unnamed protein product [Rotaria sp. Silwood2]CAF3079546.1 unnamed protein product [Rotaria sp. Silwood2]CAF4220407.1 unnamed protein product [Rotaria sp. Silwood2]CAF4465319.1 unnamed protein product [Rotaria sp. Silwood2]
MTLQGLSTAKACGLAAYGCVLWGAAALTVRHAGPACYNTDLGKTLMMVAAVPGSYILVRSVDKLFPLSSKERLAAVTLVTASALIMDGLAVTGFPSIYENESLKAKNVDLARSIARDGTGWVFFGAGVGLAIALVIS